MKTISRAFLFFSAPALLVAAGCDDGGSKPRRFAIGGSVVGLEGTGLVLELNGEERLPVTEDGAFSFTTRLPNGAAFDVRVLAQPTLPDQVCTVTGGNGTVSGGAVSTVAVSCGTPILGPFAVTGTVSGLRGEGLVLQLNGGSDLEITADGELAFAASLYAGDSYAVTVLRQPRNPAQRCTVVQGTGTVVDADVTGVSVTCAAAQVDTFAVGGTLSGLIGGALVLQNNGGDALELDRNGAFTFTTEVADGDDYEVTVKTQPASPPQTCSVEDGSGTLAGAAVDGVRVVCVPDGYTVGGTVEGLEGSGLVLQLNDTLELAVAADGAFVFPAVLENGTAWVVSVAAQPSGPAQLCTLDRDRGTIDGAAVTDLRVTCAARAFSVGGSVSGLVGAGLVLQLNGAHDLAVAADGAFTFDAPLREGDSYAVTVLSQPAAPPQTCTVAAGSGAIGDADVDGVAVTCTTEGYVIGGAVTGLVGSGLVLQLNDGADLALDADGAFVFGVALQAGAEFAVTVAQQPVDPDQICVVTGGAGTLIDADVRDVVVDCVTRRYPIRGVVNNLRGTGLKLTLNEVTEISIATSGPFSFFSGLEDGESYAVAVSAQPVDPGQVCTVSNGSGTVDSAEVTGVRVDCVTRTYSVGGTVTGLEGAGLVLQLNGAYDLAVAQDGPFAFDVGVNDGTPWRVTVLTQPAAPVQHCLVESGSGTVAAADFDGVRVTCTSGLYTVGGTLFGLEGSGLVLQLNGGADLALSENGHFTFEAPLVDGAAYEVTVSSQPTGPAQVCTVDAGSGTIEDDNVSNLIVTCTTRSFTVGGAVSGLEGSGLVLVLNDEDRLPIDEDGAFSFGGLLAGAAWRVRVDVQPQLPSQRCTVTGGDGTIGVRDVTSVAVACETLGWPVLVHAAGLAAGSVVELRINGGESLAVDGNGDFTFATPLPEGTTYDVDLVGQIAGPAQLCELSADAGTVGAAAAEVTLTCSLPTYAVHVEVQGLAGAGLRVRVNDAVDLELATNGTRAVPGLALHDGDAYEVEITGQPSHPAQRCELEGGSGSIEGADATGVRITCTTERFAVRVDVANLRGAGLQVALNGGAPTAIAAAGVTVLDTLDDLSAVSLGIAQQPTAPAQRCAISGPVPTRLDGAALTVAITCVDLFFVRGRVEGLAGDGLRLALNGTEEIAAEAGAFAFATPLTPGESFAVSVAQQPSGPAQRCTVQGGAGAITDADVGGVVVTCVTERFEVRADVRGLLPVDPVRGVPLRIALNATPVDIAAAGVVRLGALDDGSAFTLELVNEPERPFQSCVLAASAGTLEGAHAVVRVDCEIFDYALRASVSGLPGGASAEVDLVLFDGAGGELERSTLGFAADGAQVFGLRVEDGAEIGFEVRATGAVCSVDVERATVDGAPADLQVRCDDDDFGVTARVSGLLGAGLALALNGGPSLLPLADGDWGFLARLADGAGFTVTVRQQPSSPAQICRVTGGAGTVSGGDVIVDVACEAAYRVVATISGLRGSGLGLRLNGTHPAVIEPGMARFPSVLADGDGYTITVQQQPRLPAQICSVDGGAGTVAGADVEDVEVSCADVPFVVGGRVLGLEGEGLVLALNGDAELLEIHGDGEFTFTHALSGGDDFEVTVQARPTNPAQRCTVEGGSGAMPDDDVSSVQVVCEAETWRVAGFVDGLVGAGLVLLLNGREVLDVDAAGAFIFLSRLLDGATYEVEVLAQPDDPAQVCEVRNGSGTIEDADAGDVYVACSAPLHPVEVEVSGMSGGELLLSSHTGETLRFVADGRAAFTELVEDGAPFSVEVAAAPTSPAQVCIVEGGEGTIAGGPARVSVVCVPDAFEVLFNVSGLVTTGLRVALNGGAALNVPADGAYAFPGTLRSGDDYAVTIVQMPAGQLCGVVDGAGEVGTADVEVEVVCGERGFTVGGAVSGLLGDGLRLQLNGSDSLNIQTDGEFLFVTPLVDGTTFEVTVAAQPTGPAQTCTVEGGSGEIEGDDVTGVTVTCVTRTFPIEVELSGLTGGVLTLQLGDEELELASDGLDVFEAQVASGAGFEVLLTAQPEGFGQTCDLEGEAGTVGDAAPRVRATCRTTAFLVRGTVSGLAGATGLVIALNAGEELTLDADGPFAFETRVADSASWAVTIVNDPPGAPRICGFEGASSGFVTGADVSGVRVVCERVFTVGGSVVGLEGENLVLDVNGGFVGVDADDTFRTTFYLRDGDDYEVDIALQPVNPDQICTVTEGASGTIGGADVTDVVVTCETVVTGFEISVEVQGLLGPGLVLTLFDTEQLEVDADGVHAFATRISEDDFYLVEVLAEPDAPFQACEVEERLGVATADVRLQVRCYPAGWGRVRLDVDLSESGLPDEAELGAFIYGREGGLPVLVGVLGGGLAGGRLTGAALDPADLGAPPGPGISAPPLPVVLPPGEYTLALRVNADGSTSGGDPTWQPGEPGLLLDLSLDGDVDRSLGEVDLPGMVEAEITASVPGAPDNEGVRCVWFVAGGRFDAFLQPHGRVDEPPTAGLSGGSASTGAGRGLPQGAYDLGCYVDVDGDGEIGPGDYERLLEGVVVDGSPVAITLLPASLPEDGFEPDDSAATPNQLALTEPQTHTIHNLADVDVYVLEVITGGAFTLTVRDVGDGLDPMIRILDGDEAELTRVDAAGPNTNEVLSNHVLAPGRYYALIDGGGDTVGSYIVVLTSTSGNILLEPGANELFLAPPQGFVLGDFNPVDSDPSDGAPARLVYDLTGEAAGLSVIAELDVSSRGTRTLGTGDLRVTIPGEADIPVVDTCSYEVTHSPFDPAPDAFLRVEIRSCVLDDSDGPAPFTFVFNYTPEP